MPAMNAVSPTSANRPNPARPRRTARWSFSRAMVSVDLADAVVAAPASPPPSTEAGVPAVPFPERPALARMLSLRIL
jgi:hypothetical protein